jgi:DNA-binding response OmpR family regulator
MTVTKERTYRPCVVLAQPSEDGTATRLRRLGWDTYQAGDGPEARRLARMLEAELVVIDVNLPEESGWLTSAKLSQERPSQRIILLGESSERNQERASFVGASAIVPSDDALAALVAQSGRPWAA